MAADDPFHYPPELFNLLVDTIPLLCRSKDDVLLFFRGSGVPAHLISDLQAELVANRHGVNKYRHTRTVLKRLNERGEDRSCLRARREILRRVTQFEDFSACWPNDQLKAKGCVAEVRRIVNVKDSFTRMHQERDAERKHYLAERQTEVAAVRERRGQLDLVHRDLVSLFAESDSRRRGKALESVLNRLFEVEGILIREAFTISGDQSKGIVEQINGVIELDGDLYLVEMKWWKERLGPEATAQHLVRVFNRGDVRGLMIAASGYTDAAIKGHRDALTQKVVALCELRELIFLLERYGDLKSFLRQKVQAAILDRNPFYQPPIGT